jgi:glycosyltransferase involved in cell wall biosynthesis
MARIYLDARAASSPRSGVGRYVGGLVPELAVQAPHHEFVVLRPHDVPPVSSAPNVLDVPVRGTRGTLPLVMSAGKLHRMFERYGTADVYHALFHLVPFGVRRGPARPRRIVVTLHDLIWIDYARQVEPNVVAAAWRRRLALLTIPYALRVADHVLCNSHVTSESAGRWVPPARRTVVHLGVSDVFFEHGNISTTPLDGDYIAAFGVPKAYKDIACLVRAFARVRTERPNLRLVLIGGDGGVTHEIRRAGLMPAVTVVRDAQDDEVRALIRRAKAFVVPSLVEGFGLPSLEAMALGTPAIVSSAPALREVTGDAALWFSAGDSDALAAVLSKLLGDADLQRRLSDVGRRHVASFRWSRAAAGTLAIYEPLLAREHGTAPANVS